jgi:hypothetical protein
LELDAKRMKDSGMDGQNPKSIELVESKEPQPQDSNDNDNPDENPNDILVIMGMDDINEEICDIIDDEGNHHLL